MRRLVAVVVSAVLIWQPVGGAVVLASPQDARDDWTRVATLKPNQKVTVEPQKGRGKTQTGRFVANDETSITLLSKKGEHVVVARADIRRVDATPLGREAFFPLGLATVVVGGVALGVWEVKKINACQTLECTLDNPTHHPTYWLLLGAIAGAGMVVAGIGGPRRIYEAKKVEEAKGARNGDATPVVVTLRTLSSDEPAVDSTRVIAALRRAPGPGLRLVMPIDSAAVARPWQGITADNRVCVGEKR